MRLTSLFLVFCSLSVAAMELQPTVGSELLQSSQEAVSNREIGLSALQKIAGNWRYRRSERLTGELQRSTWKINQEYSVNEAYEAMLEQLGPDMQVLFECSGRSCGRSVQWANRVFEQRLLYGPDNNQRYGVYRVQHGAAEFRYILYAIERSAGHQYLHLDTLRLAPELQQ